MTKLHYKLITLIALCFTMNSQARTGDFDAGFLLKFDATLPGGYESVIDAAISKEDSLLTGIFFTPKGKTTKFYPIGDLKKGIVIIQKDDEKIAFLQSDTFSPSEGGHLNLIFKRKLGGMDYRKVQLNLIRLSRTEFRVEMAFPGQQENWKVLDRVKAKIQLLTKTIDAFEAYLSGEWVDSVKTIELPKAKPLSRSRAKARS